MTNVSQPNSENFRAQLGTTSAPVIDPTLAVRQYDSSNALHRFAATYLVAASGHSPTALRCKPLRSEALSKNTGGMPSREQQQKRSHRLSRWIRLFRTVRSCWPEQSLRSSGKADKLNPNSRTQCLRSQEHVRSLLLNHTQTLLDKDEFGDAVSVEKASDPEVWREQYEVCLQYRHS